MDAAYAEAGRASEQQLECRTIAPASCIASARRRAAAPVGGGAPGRRGRPRSACATAAGRSRARRSRRPARSGRRRPRRRSRRRGARRASRGSPRAARPRSASGRRPRRRRPRGRRRRRAPGRGEEVRALAERRGALAQLGLGLARRRRGSGARAGRRRAASSARVDHDVVALLRVEAGDAADDEGVGGDAELARAAARRPRRREADLVGAHRVGQDVDLAPRRRRRRSPTRACPRRSPSPRGAPRRRRRYSAAAGPGAAGTAPGPTRPRRRAARSRARQRGGQQLLLLVVEEQHVVGRLGSQRAPQARSSSGQRSASAAPGAAESFGPSSSGRDRDPRVAADRRLVGEHHRLVAALGERVEQLDGGELGAARGRRSS